MNRKLEAYGQISEEGKMMIKSDHLMKQWIAENNGKNIRITLEKYSGQRSNPQNAYYWGVIVESIRIAINDLGHYYTAQEIHEFLKREFNYAEVETESGNFLKIGFLQFVILSNMAQKHIQLEIIG